MAAEKTRKLSEKKRRHINRKRLIGLIVILLLIIGAAVLLLRYFSHRSFKEAELVEEIEQSGGNSVDYLHYGGEILRWSRNGAALVKEDGKELWNLSYVYENPKAKLQGDYGMIADIGGTGACIFGKEGITGVITTSKPILSHAVSSKGTAVIAVEDGTTSLLQFYDVTGRQLDISVTLEMALSGYPVDIALSPDGSGLVVSAGAYLNGGLATQLVFYNFGVGRGETNRLVGYFTYKDVIFPEVRYMGAATVAAVGDDRLVFFDLSTENKPVVLEEYVFDTEITAVELGASAAVAVRSRENGSGLVMEVFGKNGKKAFEAELTEMPRFLEAGSHYVLLTAESGLKMWDYSGVLRFEGTLAQEVQTVFAMGRRSLVQPAGGQLYRYRLR